LNCILRQPIHDLFGQAANDVLAGPVRHAIDPDHEAAGREAAEVIVTLDQHHIGAEPRSGDRSGGAGGTAADHQHIGFGEHRNIARRFMDGFCRACAPLQAASGEQFDALRRADAA
jgi:hypothetical protein